MPFQLDNLLLETGDVLLTEDGFQLALENTYRGHPVLDVFPNWETLPVESVERSGTVLDNITGLPVVKPRADQPRQSMEFSYRFTTRTELAAFRRFIKARRGSQRVFWIPTWNADLKPERPAPGSGITGTDFDIVSVGYEANLWPSVPRRHLAMIKWNHEMLLFQVSSADDNGTTEHLTTNAQFGPTPGLNPAHLMVSFLLLVRLADDVQYEYISPSHMTARIRVVEVPLEAPAV